MRNSSFSSLVHSKSRQGFTIVELLIVVVVIAILAAITIVAYNGISLNAKNSAIQSSLSQAAKKLDIFKIDDPSGLYPSTLATAGLSLVSTGDTQYVYAVSSDNKLYCLASSQGGRTYYVTPSTGSPKPGICNATTGVPGSGNVATDGSSSATLTVATYNVFNTSAPGTGQVVGTDGPDSLKFGNRFYTTEPTGIKVAGLRFYNPAAGSGATSTFLSLGGTAYMYANDWTGSTIDGIASISQVPLAIKTFSGTRTAQSWTDVLFDLPITIPAISNGSGPADLITLVVQFNGGIYYTVANGLNENNFVQSTTRPKTYLAESPYVGRGVNSVSSTSTPTYYGIDIIYTPVTP